jgi:hypothetical protein
MPLARQELSKGLKKRRLDNTLRAAEGVRDALE